MNAECNYSCKFCFHTATTSFVLLLDDAKRGLDLLKAEGETAHAPSILVKCWYTENVPAAVAQIVFRRIQEVLDFPPANPNKLVAGCKKINFSGGEPFLHQRGKFLGELCRHSKAIGSLPPAICRNLSWIVTRTERAFICPLHSAQGNWTGDREVKSRDFLDLHQDPTGCQTRNTLQRVSGGSYARLSRTRAGVVSFKIMVVKSPSS